MTEMLTWWEWWRGLPAGSELLAAQRRVTETEERLRLAELRAEELAMLNEELRQQIRANLALAVHKAREAGAP